MCPWLRLLLHCPIIHDMPRPARNIWKKYEKAHGEIEAIVYDTRDPEDILSGYGVCGSRHMISATLKIVGSVPLRLPCFPL